MTVVEKNITKPNYKQTNLMPVVEKKGKKTNL